MAGTHKLGTCQSPRALCEIVFIKATWASGGQSRSPPWCRMCSTLLEKCKTFLAMGAVRHFIEALGSCLRQLAPPRARQNNYHLKEAAGGAHGCETI